jgi:hypothetical protein
LRRYYLNFDKSGKMLAMQEKRERSLSPKDIATEMLRLKDLYQITSVTTAAAGDLLVRYDDGERLTSVTPARFDREEELWKTQIIDGPTAPDAKEKTRKINISQKEGQTPEMELVNIDREDVPALLLLANAGLDILSLSQRLGDNWMVRTDHGIYPAFIDPTSHHPLIPMAGDIGMRHLMIKSLRE